MFYIGLIIILIITIIRAIVDKKGLGDSCLFFILSVLCVFIFDCISFTISRAFMGDSVIYFFFRFP